MSSFLTLFAQVAATPIGDGMDVDGHLAYVAFVVREGRPPVAGEPSLLAMWWHAGQFALDAALRHREQFIGGEGWYLNVLIARTAVILAAAVRERYGPKRLEAILVSAAVGSIVWNLAARVVLYEFWGGSVRLCSGLRFARFGDLVAALANSESWNAWRSWPGVVGPAWMTLFVPLALAVAGSLWVLWKSIAGRWGSPDTEAC